MKRGKTFDWIPLYIDKWIFGSTRIELEPAERAVWIDLMVLAAKDDGYVRANEQNAYLPQQLAGMLCIPAELLEKTIEKCIRFDKLIRDEKGTLYLKNWNQYQLSDRWKRNFTSAKTEHSSAKREHSSKKADPIHIQKQIHIQRKKKKDIAASPLTSQVIDYLNQKTGKQFSHSSASTVRHINARIAEGRTLEDFKRVIDIKTATWLNDPKMNAYLRPETLFGSKMEAYLNEAMILSPAEKERRVGASQEKTPEEKKREADIQARIKSLAARIWEGKYNPLIEVAKSKAEADRLRLAGEDEFRRETGKIMRGEF